MKYWLWNLAATITLRTGLDEVKRLDWLNDIITRGCERHYDPKIHRNEPTF